MLSGFYYVSLNDKVITCRARGNFRNTGETLLVGDDVTIQINDDNSGYVLEVLPRKNSLLRPKVANIDYNVIVTSTKNPLFSAKLLDKIICLNEYSRVDTILVFTKLDLLNAEEREYFSNILAYYKKIGYQVFTNDDIASFKKFVSKKYISICGQSGSGKSTFINSLTTNLKIETKEISKALGRGRHTTRHTEFYKIDDFYIADTPGFSSLDITFIDKDDLASLFVEFLNFDCKFRPCFHINEPKCSVKENLEKNILQSRYESYKAFFTEKNEQKRSY